MASPSKPQPGRTASLPKYSDPEEGARFLSAFGATTKLAAQLKVRLLLTEHVLIPGGFLFDGPAAWSLLTSSADPGLLDLLSTPLRGSVEPTVVLVKHKVNGELDENFDLWLGRTRRRQLKPSVLRTAWAAHKNLESGERAVAVLQNSSTNVAFSDYAQRLQIAPPKEALEALFRLPYGVAAPGNRHEKYFQIVRSRIVGVGDHLIPKGLRELLDEPSRTDLQRGEIRKRVPEAWDLMGERLNSWRRECYFENWQGSGLQDGADRPASVDYRQLDARREALSRQLEVLEPLDGVKLPVATGLTFSDVLRLRQNEALADAIRTLDRAYAAGDTECFLKQLRPWARALEAAGGAQNATMSGWPYQIAAAIACGALPGAAGQLQVAIPCAVAGLLFLGIGIVANQPVLRPEELIAQHVKGNWIQR